ncbi:MAG: RNA polymerase sigma factor [Clostridium perfringens]|uniref:RNA polymerase sigma factor n=1 Tax=Paraclostridium bifermentans TaxID=1490 RepID=UPI002900D231|nr:RNA polymerase sigma factor [Paraclostridium bifermentans]MDU2094445.1 RNA polymerase sigma factor [Clostridium perfringens]MDU3337750.1 RNA polymerase sigma factor [Paraclostridium bifermentans]
MNDFENLYNQHFKYVYRYILSICKNTEIAEDITQETFFKALKNLKNFKGQCNVRSCLCQIGKNTYFSYLKKLKKQCEIDICESNSISCLEDNLILEENVSEVHKEIDKLENVYKEVFCLRTFGELSFLEIAKIHSKSESWARVTYHRAKLKIRKNMEVNIYEKS